ncbi:hypothetical protein Tco_0741053 [Tanacetum coccineum]
MYFRLVFFTFLKPDHGQPSTDREEDRLKWVAGEVEEFIVGSVRPQVRRGSGSLEGVVVDRELCCSGPSTGQERSSGAILLVVDMINVLGSIQSCTQRTSMWAGERMRAQRGGGTGGGLVILCEGSAIAVGLLKAISVVVNLLLEGRCPKVLAEFVASAPLTPLLKPDNGIRPIAWRAIWRRFGLVKVAMRVSRKEMSQIPWGLFIWGGSPPAWRGRASWREHILNTSVISNGSLAYASCASLMPSTWRIGQPVLHEFCTTCSTDSGTAANSSCFVPSSGFPMSYITTSNSVWWVGLCSAEDVSIMLLWPRGGAGNLGFCRTTSSGMWHDLVRDVLYDVLKRAGISSRKEAPVNFLTDPLEGRSTLRPADILVFGWAGGKHACVDLTGVSPLVGLRDNGFVAGQAALKAESSKVAKHGKACLENQHVFNPFAFDTLVFLHRSKEFLNMVPRVVQSNFSDP